jgi:hypothetical protein
VKDVGYVALFSADGGFIGPTTNPFDIPRLGASSEHSLLCLMIDIEGLSTL